MGKDSYNSMLWLARSGRYIIGNDDKYNELIKKIKIDFKLNNNSWNDLLRGDKKEIEGKITDVIYHLYSNDKPDNSESLNKEEKERFLESFESLLTEGVREKVEIKVQGQNERPFFELTKEQLLNGSAYRILPKDYRKRYLTRSHLMARLTINVNKKNYENLAKALIEIYDHDLNKNIIQAKIMGPRKLGRLTDQAVIYLAEADLEKAQEVSQQLIDLLPPDALVDHTPIGMTQLMKGISYSETMGGQSTSHGESRAVIMAKAITESLLTDEKLKIVLPRMLQHYGYDSKDPAFISLAIKDRFLKTSLYHPEIEHEIETPSRDIQNFTLNPEVFCYGYKLNESSLNKIKNIPEIGKVIFYRNNHGYDVNFVDNSYEAGIPYALDCYFLNTDLKEKESEVPEYVNVSKKNPINKFIFIGEIMKGSVIVTDFDSESYRVYYDNRYHSSLLYDNVVMAVDEMDYFNERKTGANMFMYFNGEQWKLIHQKSSESDKLIYEPNKIMHLSPGEYSFESNNSKFLEYRTSVHEKLKMFANKLDVDIYGSDKDKKTSIDWNDLSHKIKKELKVKSNEFEIKAKEINELLKVERNSEVIAKTKDLIEINRVLNSVEIKQFNEVYSNIFDVEYAYFWQGIKRKKGMDSVVKAKSSQSSEFQDNILVSERYENLLYLHKITRNKNFRENFFEGTKNYQKEVIDGFDNSMTSLELKKLYLTADFTAKERGALYRHVQDASYAEYIDKVLLDTGKISEFFYDNGSKVNRLIPQDFYLSAIKSDSGGRCYPLVRAMSVALVKEGEIGANKLIDKLFISAANPEERNSYLLKEGLKNLHSNTDAIESSDNYGRLTLKSIKNLLDIRDETMMLAVNSQNHSMLIGKMINSNKKTFYFYDPNFGVFSFDDSTTMFSAVKKFFIDKQFSSYYSAYEIDKKPAFNTVYIDTEKMDLVSIGNNLTVGDLSEEEDLTVIEVRQNKANEIVKSQNEIYSDLQLKQSLIILDAQQWADKISEATYKISSENQLEGKWLPLFYNIERKSEGQYRIQFIHVDDPSLTRWVETTDRTFAEFHQYNIERMKEFTQYYHLQGDEFELKEQSIEGCSIDGLNAGIAIQAIIQWSEDRNRNENTKVNSKTNLSAALKIHSYVNYALMTHSIAKDGIHVTQLVGTAMRRNTQITSTSIGFFNSSLARVANEGLMSVFNGALIGFDIYELSQAENESQTVVFGTQLAFDSASLIASTAAIGANALGYTTASASFGGMGVIVAGLGIGFSALARNFAEIGESAKAVGLYFHALDIAYQNGGYEYKSEENVLIPRFGAIFKTLDLQNNLVEFDSQYIYRTSDKSSGGGRRNYIFWAGNFPTIVRDRQQAINIREGIGYQDKTHHVNFSDREILFLPITPKSFLKYDYNLWPGATTRHDSGFDVIRRLEETNHFDYDFYIFPSENTITHIYHEYVETPVAVKLDANKRNLVIPSIPIEWRNFMNYKIYGNGGEYKLTLNEGAKITLIENSDEWHPSHWLINATVLKNDKIEIFENRIKVGGVDIYIEEKNRSGKYFIVTNKNETNEIDFLNKRINVISENENSWKDDIPGFERYLHELVKEHRFNQQYVIIENYQYHGNNVGRAYFEVKNERFIFTHSIEQEKSKGILGAVLENTAIFYSLELPLIWVTEIESGNIFAEYRLKNNQSRPFEILNSWKNKDIIYFSCRYKDTNETANYQIIDSKIEIVSLTASPDVLIRLAKTPTNLAGHKSEEILQNYLIHNENNVQYESIDYQNIADMVMISGQADQQIYHRYWLRKKDDTLIKPNLSPSLDYGVFPRERERLQSHWAIPEDLNLAGSLFDSEGTEIFYFYSDKEKVIYQQKGAGQDILNAIKPSAWFMYTPNLERAFTWKGHIMTVDTYGVVSQINAKGDLSVVALNDKWFQGHPYWWRDLENKYRDKSALALLGIKNENNENVLPAWFDHGNIVIAHQLSSENELQFLGANINNSGALIFDKKQKKLYEQPFVTEKELLVAFNDDAKLINNTLLPPIKNLYPSFEFNNIEVVSGGLLMSAESGEIFYVDLLSSQSNSQFNHLSSSLIIHGGKGDDILSPTVIDDVKNIVLSGGEGQDRYLISMETWKNYQTIIIDNDSYDEIEDLIILPVVDVKSLIVMRRDDDLVVFDMHSSTTLILRQVFDEESKGRHHLRIQMNNQPNTMSLEAFSEEAIHVESLFKIDKKTSDEAMASSEHYTQLIVDKITSFNVDDRAHLQGGNDLLLSTNTAYSHSRLLTNRVSKY